MSRRAVKKNPQYQQFIEQAEQLNEVKNYEGALVAAKAAMNLQPDDAEAWWHIGINQNSLDNLEGALKAFKKVTELGPHFAQGWSRYGIALLESGEPLEAQDALERALEEDDENLLALIYLSDMYEESGNEDGEFECLVKLERKDLLNPDKWNRFGILHYKRKNFFDAINFYSKAAANSDDPAGLFNLGLVYNHPEVSQDANAVDVWRLTQKKFPNFDKAGERIAGLLPRLLKLANDVRAGKVNLLEKDQWYGHYLNPFQLLNIDKSHKLAEIDAKTIQRYKKALLHEIELENGKVAWLENLHVDRSRAISLCEELNNDEYKKFHWTVYQDELLLEFLSKGSIEHFLVHPEKSPLGTLEILDKDGGKFRKWLSEPFSKQYNAVMTRTLEQEKISNLESLLDGRLWLPVDQVMTVRWGITVDNSNYSKSYDFLLAITGEGETQLNPKEIQFKWSATSADSIKKGEEFFSALVNAAVSYVMPKLAQRIKNQLKNNEVVKIGPCAITSRGVAFKTTGWFGFSEKDHFVEWINLQTEMANGELIVKDRIGGGKVSFPIKTTNNAMILKFLTYELGR